MLDLFGNWKFESSPIYPAVTLRFSLILYIYTLKNARDYSIHIKVHLSMMVVVRGDAMYVCEIYLALDMSDW